MNVSDVLSAYKKPAGIVDEADSLSAPSAAGGGQSFADALQNFAGDTIDTLKESEKAAMAHATGTKSDLASVVTSINNAEIVLEEVTAIRDKVIAAYQAITSGAI
jgi:flagellar hook-basal body complex protein FliE